MITDEVSKSAALYGQNKYNPLEEHFFFRPLSRRLARTLKDSSVHPDHLSVLGFLLTITAAALFAYTSVSPWLIVAVLFLCLFFDKADGDLARIQGIAGTKGQYIDGMLDAVGEVFLITGIALAAHPFLALAMLSTGAVVFFNYHGASAPLYLNIIPTTHTKGDKKSGFDWFKEIFFYGRAKLFIVIIILTIIHHLLWLFVLLPFLFPYVLLVFYRNIFVKGLTRRS